MKKVVALILSLALLLGLVPGALAVNEDVEGKIVIYTSMYQFVYEAMKKELEKEFPNLEVEFYYAGTGTLISQIAGDGSGSHQSPERGHAAGGRARLLPGAEGLRLSRAV